MTNAYHKGLITDYINYVQTIIDLIDQYSGLSFQGKMQADEEFKKNSESISQVIKNGYYNKFICKALSKINKEKINQFNVYSTSPNGDSCAISIILPIHDKSIEEIIVILNLYHNEKGLFLFITGNAAVDITGNRVRNCLNFNKKQWTFPNQNTDEIGKVIEELMDIMEDFRKQKCPVLK